MLFSYPHARNLKKGGRVPAGKRYLTLDLFGFRAKSNGTGEGSVRDVISALWAALLVTDSGGKDSAVCREIVRRSGISFEIQHNLTTADAPQTCNPIVDWRDADVWNYIESERLEVNSLYLKVF